MSNKIYKLTNQTSSDSSDSSDEVHNISSDIEELSDISTPSSPNLVNTLTFDANIPFLCEAIDLTSDSEPNNEIISIPDRPSKPYSTPFNPIIH